jgi:hypothetical protein
MYRLLGVSACVVSVIEVITTLWKVSIIMLKKVTERYMKIAREMMPPVKVLVSASPWNLRSCIEEKRSSFLANLLICLNICGILIISQKINPNNMYSSFRFIFYIFDEFVVRITFTYVYKLR